MIWLLLSAMAYELPPVPVRPAAPAATVGECGASVPLQAGEPLPAGLVDSTGRVLCSAVLVPTSDAADLLATEAYANALRTWSEVAVSRHRYDVSALQRDLDYTRQRLELAERPPPLGQRPAVQRTIGRVETLVTLAAIGGVMYGLQAAAR